MSDQTGPSRDDVQNQQAMETSLNNQADIVNRLNESLRERVGLEEQSAQNLEGQADFMSSVRDALEEMADHYHTFRKENEKFKKSLEDAAKQNDDNESGAIKMFNSYKKSMTIMKLFKKNLFNITAQSGKLFKTMFSPIGTLVEKLRIFIVDALDAIASHPLVKIAVVLYKSLEKVGKMMVGIFTQGIKFGTRFVKFTAGLPLKIAGVAAKIGNSLRQDLIMTIGTATEATKELFDISSEYGSGAGSAIKSFADASSSSLLEFRDITSDSVKLFGKGAAGIAARMQTLAQRLGEMGSYADLFGESLKGVTGGSAEQFNFMEKSLRSLGATAEDVAYMSQEAAKQGVSINTVLFNTRMSLKNVAKESGVNQKMISKNFLVLRRDIINFGHLSTEQLQQTSAELIKMGLSAQDAASMFGKLDTFESAAQMSAMLSQSFGMNLDALKLIKAENPQEIFEDLRDSMMSTGRSFDELNRHEKSLMASTTGLSAASLKALMDFRDTGMSYEEAMKKMKENSPEARQLKAFDSMTGSLKEIKNIMSDTSFLSSFMKGLTSSIVLATGLGDKFQAVSKRMEDFYLAAISFGKDSNLMSGFRGAFKPIEDTINVLVGSGGSDKGLFSVDKLSGVKDFMNTFTRYLGRAFKDGSNVVEIQNDFSKFINRSFDPESFLSNANNPGMTLFKAGGKLIGQFLKGFAAIGPGMINFLNKGLTHVVDYITGQGSLFGGSAITEQLVKLFGLSKTDQEGIINTFNLLVDTVIGQGGPLMRMIYWMNREAIKLVSSAVLKIGEAIWDSLFGYNSYIYQTFKTWALTNPVGQLFRVLGLVGDVGPFKSQEGIFKKAVESNVGVTLKNLDLTKMAGNNFDEQQAADVGKLYSALLNEQKKNPTNQAIQDLIDTIKSQRDNIDTFSFRDDKVIKNIIDKAAGIRGDSEVPSLIIKKQQANDWFSDMFGAGGKAVVERSSGGMTVTSLPPGDQLVAGMEGGPVVNAIKYSGSAVSGLVRKVDQLIQQKQAGSVNVIQQGGALDNKPIHIELVMEKGGEVLAQKLIPPLLSNDIIGKATNPSMLKGARGLGDFSTRNFSGGSTEGSSVG